MSNAERIARAKGWFVQQAEDGLWYYADFHGDPDESGDFDTEEEAWVAAAQDNG